MSFPAYPTYKDSGVEWQGEVPAEWRIERLRLYASLVTTKAEAQTRPIALENIEGWSGKLIDTDTEFQADGVEFAAGDILFGKLRPYLAKVYAAEFSGQAVGDFHVIRPSSRANTTFLKYVILTREMISLIDGSTYGAKMPRASWDFIRELRIAFPPPEEQATIAAFLDCETAKIDALVEEQRRLIALLKEKRQSVVSHAVTKGLNPDAPMKDSGVEWLGEVPAHWEVRPVKSLAVLAGRIGFRGYSTSDLVNEGEGAVTLSPSNIGDGELKWDKCTFISWEKFNESPEIIVEPHDVVIVKTGSTFGKVGFFRSDEVPAVTINPQLLLLKRAQCEPEFLFHSLNVPHVQALIKVNNTGGTIPTMTQEFVGNLDIPVPPKGEQDSILQLLVQKTAGFADLIGVAEQALDLLRERRAALISAAVTGKIDVRGSAKVLFFPADPARVRGLIAAEIIERSAHQTTFGRVKLQKIAYLAEAHAGVAELEGTYLREAAGPLDREMISEMEREASALAGVRVEQPAGVGSAVTYLLGVRRGVHRQDLATLLGDRAAKFDKLIKDIGTINTKGAEAVATLYAVWNDALIDGETPSDIEVTLAVLSEWHPEKSKKFRINELQTWLDWMRRHGIVPTGAGPKTSTGRLFA